MSSRSYQHFTIERPTENELIVRKNTQIKLLVSLIIGIAFLTVSVIMLYISKGAGLIAVYFMFICTIAVTFNALSESGKKRVHAFDKDRDLILLNDKAVLRLSQVICIEVYTCFTNDDDPETYRVVVVSEGNNRVYKLYEEQDEYDMRRLAEVLSAFLDVPIKERQDLQK